jgi:hypothetical protein
MGVTLSAALLPRNIIFHLLLLIAVRGCTEPGLAKGLCILYIQQMSYMKMYKYIYIHIDKDFRLTDKRQTPPSVREGARIRQERICQSTNIWP